MPRPPAPLDATDTRSVLAPRDYTFQRFVVRVTAGPDRGRECASDGAELGIGTAPANALVLTDPTVSRHHCAIRAAPDGFHLRDLGSTNGTRLAGCAVEAIRLRPGVTLELGETSLRFESLPDEIHEPLSHEDRCGRLLGCSPSMRRIFAMVPRIAGADATLLLEGETGTGKGLLAEAIHQASPRAAGPLVVVDCGSIPPTLIESELFGHGKGAFTGAHAPRAGAFEAARGGTVFLDEIGELPLEMQPKLLRALEERTVKRVGTADPVKLDVRVIAATNRDLRAEVNRGTFRSDLFYRLNVLRVRLPPLRERREDILLLVEHFYAQFAGPDADPAPPAELLRALGAQEWPGNVRELRNAVERAVLMEDPALWQAEEQAAQGQPPAAASATEAEGALDPGPFDEALSFRAAKERAVARWERWYLAELLQRSGGSVRGAARAARMDRNHLRELLHRHHVDSGDESP